jgi:hypothetical protein
MGINRTDSRCMDILDQHGSMSAGDLAEASQLIVEPLKELYAPVAARYSDDDLRLLIDFTRQGRELQERHAAWLRERLKSQSSRTSAP